MPRFECEVTVSCSGVIFVEAEDEKAAREKIGNELPDVSWFGCDVDDKKWDGIADAWVSIDSVLLDNDENPSDDVEADE